MTSCCINLAIISNGFTSPFGKKEKKNCHLYNTILSLYISYQVSTYHIKTLQEESAKKSNIPWIWRIIYGHKLPYMKKTKITLYEEDKKEEASMRCSLLHGSWDQILRRCPSVCLSFRHTFLTMFPSSYHLEITTSYYQWQKWRPCKRSRSKVKVTKVNTELSCFRTVTPVWIQIWRNDTQSLMVLRRGALLFLKVICQISRSHSSKNHRFWPKLVVSGL